MAARESVKKKTRKPQGKPVTVFTCRELKTVIAREIKSSVKDRKLATKLINSLGIEVAYGTGGGGGGIGVT